MLNHNTLEGLKSLRLPAMASGLLAQREQPDYSSLSFEERLGLLVDAELLQRQNRRLERVFKAAKLAAGASSDGRWRRVTGGSQCPTRGRPSIGRQ